MELLEPIIIKDKIMFKPFLTLAILLSAPLVQAELDVSIPKKNCLKVAEVVRNQDVVLLKSMYMPLNVTEQQYKEFIKKKYDWAFVNSYTGINEFTLGEVTVFENAKNSKNNTVQRSALRWGHDLEVWVKYAFESTNRNTNAPATNGGFCRFAMLDNTWYMVNLL